MPNPNTTKNPTRSDLDSLPLASLKRKIRYAEEPNNPVLINQLFQLGSHKGHETTSTTRTRLLAQYYLLLDTIADEALPSHWRRVCLDQIHRPLYALHRISHCELSKQQVRALFYELQTTGLYLGAGLAH